MLKKEKSPLELSVAFACDERGFGVAYARGVASQRSLRVTFRSRYGAQSRAAAYAALEAIAHELRRRHVDRVRLLTNDAELVADLAERRSLPTLLVMPYIRLGCELNRFAEAQIALGESGDLQARARAEVALQYAA